MHATHTFISKIRYQDYRPIIINFLSDIPGIPSTCRIDKPVKTRRTCKPRRVPHRVSASHNDAIALGLGTIVPSERIASSGGHLRRSGGQSAQRTHQACQCFPECGPASLVRCLADVSQIVVGISIIIVGAAIIEISAAITGPGADTGPGLLQDAATILLSVAIDASPGRGNAAAGIAVPMLLTESMLLFVEMLLQLHIAQSPVHQSD